MSDTAFDLIVIGAGPAGAAAAIVAARSGASVLVFDKAPYGRDKVCGDGLTPRAVGALNELKIELEDAHRIDGLRMIAGEKDPRACLAKDGTVPAPRCGLASTQARRISDGRCGRSWR